MICWFCYWGWPPWVEFIFDEALEEIGGDGPLLFGPAHIVWEDENFDLAQLCLDHFDEHSGTHSEEDLAIVRRSLEQLRDVPNECLVAPEDYDGKHPENYPPAWAEASSVREER